MHDVSSLRVSRFARLLFAACLIVGPVAGIAVRASVPASSTASAARSAIDDGRHSAATQMVLIADGFLFLLVPAALAATALAWHRAPLLSLLAGVFSLVGWTSIVMLAAQDALFAETGRAIYGSGDALRIASNWSGSALTIRSSRTTELVGTAADGAEAIALAIGERPQCRAHGCAHARYQRNRRGGADRDRVPWHGRAGADHKR